MRVIITTLIFVLLWSPVALSGAEELRNLVLYQELSDEEIADVFYDTVLGSEDPTIGKFRAGTIRKHVGAIKYLVDRRSASRFTPLELMLQELPSIFPMVPLTPADKLQNANFRILLVSGPNEMEAKVREIWGSKVSAEQVEFVERQGCVTLLDYYGESSRIRRSTVIIPTSSNPECAFEEIVQALGPINDTRQSTKTTMNDRSKFAQMPLVDLYVANMLYDPEVKAGMSKEQVDEILPIILKSTKKTLTQLTESIRQ